MARQCGLQHHSLVHHELLTHRVVPSGRTISGRVRMMFQLASLFDGPLSLSQLSGRNGLGSSVDGRAIGVKDGDLVKFIRPVTCHCVHLMPASTLANVVLLPSLSFTMSASVTRMCSTMSAASCSLATISLVSAALRLVR